MDEMLMTELKLDEDLVEKLPAEIADTYWKMASEIAAKEEHVPMFFVVRGRKMIQLVATDEFRDVEGKDRVSSLVRAMARNADVVVIICEAFSVTNPNKEAIRDASHGRLYQNKDAQEILTVLVQHRKYGTAFWTAEIFNGPDGRKIGPVRTGGASSGNGRFEGMMPPITVAEA